MGLVSFKSRANYFLLADAALSLLGSSTNFTFLFILSIGWHCGAGIFRQMGCISLSLSLTLPTSLNNNNDLNCILLKRCRFKLTLLLFHKYFNVKATELMNAFDMSIFSKQRA